MNGVKILDCTLRDGGRVIDCEFADSSIKDIVDRLTKANIDIIEIGFLRDANLVNYNGNSTFFTEVEQIKTFMPKEKRGTNYVAFIDYGMYDFDLLKPYDGKSIDGIRVGFTKEKYINEKKEIIKSLKTVKEKGYVLYIQDVNTIGYTDKELLGIIDMANEIKPYSFGLVDTYGAMYVNDVRRLYSLIDNNLDEDIAIDFHSHNNLQLSFSLAQEIISLSENKRTIIIDSTLNGMGKCAGNLNTELILDYMTRKCHSNYDLDEIMDIIDDYMYSIKKKVYWGYSIPSMLAGVYKSHPNNIIFLTEKYRLSTKEIGYIISMIDANKRQHYDYDNIHKIYLEYNHTKVDDKEDVDKIRNLLANRNILLLLPGSTIEIYKKRIIDYIEKNNCFVISVNHITNLTCKENRAAFFGSEKRYKKFNNKTNELNVIITSNISSDDNTTIMLLNLLNRIDISDFSIAGFDGYSKDNINYYDNDLFEGERFLKRFEQNEKNMRKMLKKYIDCSNKKNIKLITPSVYSDILDKTNN